jgi:hypothetical protein
LIDPEAGASPCQKEERTDIIMMLQTTLHLGQKLEYLWENSFISRYYQNASLMLTANILASVIIISISTK